MTQILVLDLPARHARGDDADETSTVGAGTGDTGTGDTGAGSGGLVHKGTAWWLVRDGAVAQTGVAALPDALGPLLKRFADVDRILALLPGLETRVDRALVPSQRESEARAAAPFVIEDDLAVDPEDVHVALSPAQDDGRRILVTVDREAMAQWRRDLAAAAGRDIDLIPESLAWPAPEEGFVLVDRGGYALLRGADGTALSLEDDLVSVVLPAIMADAGAAVPLMVFAHHPERYTDALEGTGLETRAPVEGADFVMACAGAGRPPLSLLQGPFKLRGRLSFDPSVWVRSGALAASLLLALVAIQVVEAVRLDARASQTHAKAEALFRETFPDVRRVVNPRAQMAARLRALGTAGTAPFLALTGLLYGGLKDLGGVELQDLRYYAERGEIGARVTYRDYADLERLKARVAQRGGRLVEGGSRQQGGVIEGDVTVGLP